MLEKEAEEWSFRKKYTYGYSYTFKQVLDAYIDGAKPREEQIAELKDDNKVMADNYSKMEQKFYSNLTKAREIILKLYNAGRDVLMCRAEEKAYDNLDEAINDKSIEQFLKDVEE